MVSQGRSVMAELVPEHGFAVQSADGAAVVTPPAEIDETNARQLQDALASAATRHVTVVVDLTANEFCDSAAISVLVMALKRARAGGGEVRLVMGQPAVRRIFKVTGVDKLFPLFDSVADALNGQHPAG